MTQDTHTKVQFEHDLLILPRDAFSGAEQPGEVFDIRDSWIQNWPADHSHGGCLYAVEFDGGLVKVGMSSLVGPRIRSHVSTARRFGRQARLAWVSPTHKQYELTERAMLSHLRTLVPAVDRETFQDEPGRVMELARGWWDEQRVHPPGEFPGEQLDRLMERWPDGSRRPPYLLHGNPPIQHMTTYLGSVT